MRHCPTYPGTSCNVSRRRIAGAAGSWLFFAPLVATAQASDCATVTAADECPTHLTQPQWLDQYFGRKDFGAPLAVSRFLDRTYYLIQAFTWTPTGDSAPLGRIVAPKGFVTDFASVPAVFWSVLPPDDEYVTAAVIHDWLYWNQATTRAQADQAMWDCMAELGVSKFKLASIYVAVRTFGDAAWSGNAALKAKGERRVLKRTPTDLKVRWSEWKRQPDVFE